MEGRSLIAWRCNWEQGLTANGSEGIWGNNGNVLTPDYGDCSINV